MRKYLFLIWMLGCGLIAYGQASSISPAKMLKVGNAGDVLITASGVATWVPQSILQSGVNYWSLSSGNVTRGTGSVGIGLSVPTEKLHVSGGNVLIANTKTIKLDATDGYVDLPDVSTELGGGVHNNGNGELWYNGALYRLRYTRNDVARSVACVEDDFIGFEGLTSTTNPTMIGDQWYYEQFDGVNNAVNVTVGASLLEGKIYTVRCRRNVVAAGGNLITFYAASGYTFAIDGAATLTPTSYSPADYEVFTMRRMGTVIIINK